MEDIVAAVREELEALGALGVQNKKALVALDKREDEVAVLHENGMSVGEIADHLLAVS